MNFHEAMAYILSFTDYERSPAQALAPIHYNLDRVRRLLELLGNPQQRFKSIQIAGTKGKGSTGAMIAGALACAGYRTGFFSSPHLHSFRERIRVNGELISEEDLCHAVELVKPQADVLSQRHPALGALTTFEITTAVAFEHFARGGVDFAVLEVGLGGRLDATNVVEPLVAVITSISLDHTQVLGNSIAEIATEKAGIIKTGGIVVLAPQEQEALDTIRRFAAERNARLLVAGKDWTWLPCHGQGNAVTVSGLQGQYECVRVPLLGEHQLLNAATAIAAVEALRFHDIKIDPERVREGIAGVRWPGRMEVLSPRPAIVVDGAHNADSMRKLSAALRSTFPGKRLTLIVGTSVDKDISGMLREIAPLAGRIIVTKSDHPRSTQPETIAQLASAYARDVSIIPNVREALLAARETALPEDLICVTGSLFVVAEAREALGFVTI